MKPLSFLIFISSGIFAAAQTEPAHTTEDEAVHLTNFEVTTHPYARNQSEIAQPTQVMGLDAVDRNQAMTLGDMLANQPGVTSTYFGPGAGRPIIRALGGPRVAVLQNGNDTIDASVISPDHAVSIDPLLIERIEITRGPAALLQGGSSLGGAVNVVTHRIHTTLPDAQLHGRTEGRVSSANDERSGALVVEGAAGALAWHVDSFYRETNDIDIPGYAESKYRRVEEAAEHDEDHDDEHDEDQEAFGTLPNSFVESQGGSLGLSWITETGFFGGAFSVFETRYGVPPGAHNHAHGEEEEHHDEPDGDHHDEEAHDHAEDHDEPGEELVSIDLQQHRFELQGEQREPFAGLRAIRWNAAYADYQHTEFEGDEIGTVFTNEGFDLRIDALHQPWGELTGAIGLELSYSDFDAVGAEAFLPPSETQNFALMLFEELELEQGLWQFGVRSDWQSINVQDGSGRTNDGAAWAGSAGWVSDIDDQWTFATSISITERLPITQELFADGPHIGTSAYEIGDPNLSNEISYGLDLSLRREGDILSGTLTAFVNDFNGFIFENPTGAEAEGLPVYQFEQRDARFYGAEATATVHVLQNEHGHLDWTLGGDMVNATNTTDDTYLPRITPVRLRTGLDWAHRQLRLGTELVHTMGQDRLAPGETRTDDFTMISAYASYRFLAGNQSWDLMLRGQNLTDSEARVHTSFLKDIAPLPGRNISLSLRMNF